MLISAQFPLYLWAEAVYTAVYLHNRSPTVALKDKTPFECWYGKKPDVSELRVFGCVCYYHVPASLRQKLDPKSRKAVFVGYPLDTKGYKVYDPISQTFYRSRNVVFNENEFYTFNDENKLNVSGDYCIFPPEYENCEVTEAEQITQTANELHENVVIPMAELNIQDIEQVGVFNNNIHGSEQVGVINNNIRGSEQVGVQNNDALVQKTYEETFMKQVEALPAKRQSKPKVHFDEANVLHDQIPTASLTDTTISLTSEICEPKSIKDALNSVHSEEWKKAMNSEYSSLMKNKTWTLVPRPADINVVGNRWLYKLKRNGDGTINRFKSRLVAQGFTQTHGIDYDEVFSPVARNSAIRCLLALANANDWEIHQMDVKTAFLNGILDCDVYMEQPPGFIDPEKPDYVCKLEKSLYGLKQSARCWNNTLDEFLKSQGYIRGGADGCIYVKVVQGSTGGQFVIFVIYVDDIIPISNNVSMLEVEKALLCDKFEMVDNGDAHYVLGMLIKRDRKSHTLSITQPIYLKGVLEKFKMSDCKAVATPMEPGTVFQKRSENEVSCDKQMYQQAVGCLTYAATSTRPDICVALGVLSQYMSDPSESHWCGIKRLLRYLRGTLDYGLVFSPGDGVLVGFSDADWAGDLDTRRSTSGYVFKVGNSTVSWCSKKQKTVAKSTTEAEYVALSMAVQECIWLRRLLDDIGCSESVPTVIYEDNNGAIDLSRNAKHHTRTKHIDISYHFTREKVQSGEVSIVYCPTDEMVADVMTKGLARMKFQKFRDALGVYGVVGVG